MTKRQLLIIIGSFFILAFVAGYLVISFVPNVAAQGANALRGLIGKEAVGQLETVFFTLQDNVKRVQYDAGLAAAEAPWEIATVGATAVPPTSIPPSPTSQPTLPPTTSETAPEPTPTAPPTAVPS
ncbi:MAG: hypothetical protein R6X34_06195, partial [Chloroflexota bacterium]